MKQCYNKISFEFCSSILQAQHCKLNIKITDKTGSRCIYQFYQVHNPGTAPATVSEFKVNQKTTALMREGDYLIQTFCPYTRESGYRDEAHVWYSGGLHRKSKSISLTSAISPIYFIT